MDNSTFKAMNSPESYQLVYQVEMTWWVKKFKKKKNGINLEFFFFFFSKSVPQLYNCFEKYIWEGLELGLDRVK